MVPRGWLKTFSFVAVSVEDMLIRGGGGEDFLIGSSDLWIEEEEREGDGVNKWQLIPLCFSTTDYMHSSTPYHPHGAPIFPIRQTQQLFPEETSCCVKKKPARQTTAHSYIQ